MLAGLVIAWGVLVPIMTALHPVSGPSAADLALKVWSTDVRMMGAGVIGIGRHRDPGRPGQARHRRPEIGAGGLAPREGGRRRHRPHRAGLPIFIVGLVTMLSMVPAGWLLASFLQGGALAELAVPLVAVGIAYILIAGMFAAAVCGYMAGLIGSSNSPVSGIAILAVLGAALMRGHGRSPHHGTGSGARAGGLRAVRHHRGAGRGRDRQRQPAGFEDRPTGRRDAVEAAGRPADRRGRRFLRGPARARTAQPRQRLRRRAQPERDLLAAAGRAAGRADLDAGQGRHRRQPAVAPARLRRG